MTVWRRTTEFLIPNRYDDWVSTQHPASSDRKKRLCPVMIRLNGPEDSSVDGWVTHLEESLRKIASFTAEELMPFLTQGAESNSPIANGDLLAFRAIIDSAKIEINETDTIRDILNDEDNRRTLATYLSQQSNAALDYLMMIQMYLPESVAYEHAKLKEIGEVLFIGQSLDDQLDKLTSEAKLPERLQEGDATVMLGIIDGGFPFAHDRLRTGPDNCTSRIDRLWVQLRDTLVLSPKFGVSNGITLTNHMINEILDNQDDETMIYTSEIGDFLKINGHPISGINTRKGKYQPLMNQASHGMHVLGTALDAFENSGGDLDKTKICLVELPVEVTTDTSGSLLGTYYVQAVRRLMQWADEVNLPLVINMSYGMTAGPKNTKHPAELVIERMVNARSAYLREKLSNGSKAKRLPNTTIVLPSGNSRQSNTAVSLKLQPGQVHEETWMILPDDRTPSFLEIWVEGGNTKRVDGEKNKIVQVELNVAPPSVYPSLTVDFSSKAMAKPRFLTGRKDPLVAVYADKCGLYGPDSNAGQSFFVAVAPTKRFEGKQRVAPHGRWMITLKNCDTTPINLSIIAQRDDTPLGFPLNGRQSFFEIDPWEQREEQSASETFSGRISDLPIETTLAGPMAPRVVNAANGNAIASSPQVLSVGALVNIFGGDDAPFDEQWVPSIYSSDTMRSVGDPAPDRMTQVDRGYLSWGKLGHGTLSGSKLHLSGTSIAAPQIAGEIAAEYSLNRR